MAKKEQGKREWELERETVCHTEEGGCIEKVRCEQKLESNDFRQGDILGAKHSKKKNRALDLRCKFAWHYAK